MNISQLTLRINPPFDFKATANSHGWVVLAPNSWDPDLEAVSRVERLSSGQVVLLEISKHGSSKEPRIKIRVTHQGQLPNASRKEIRASVRRIFRTEEDLSEFYDLCQDQGPPWSQLKPGIGRLLRSPSLFEDMIKTICTTNIQWSGTKSMLQNFVSSLGDPFPGNSTQKASSAPDPSGHTGIYGAQNCRQPRTRVSRSIYAKCDSTFKTPWTAVCVVVPFT